MAGTTIHSLAYVVTANTEQFEKGMVATRAELRASKKIMEESVPTIDKYRMAVANADSMLAKGLIDKRAHASVINKLNTDYHAMSGSVDMVAAGTGKISENFKRMAGAAAGMFTVSAVIGKIRHEFENIDATVKDAEKLGIAIEDLMRLRGVANMAGDATAESVDKAIAKLNMNLKDLREGSDSAIALFEQVGLTAADMEGLDLGQSFLKVADAISVIEGADKQLAITQEILGKGAGDLANMLKMGADEIQRMGAGIPAVNAIDAEKIARAKDAMESLDRSMSKLYQTLAVQLAPLIEKMAALITLNFADNNPASSSGMVGGLAGMPTGGLGSLVVSGSNNPRLGKTGGRLQGALFNDPEQRAAFDQFMKQAQALDPNFSFSNLEPQFGSTMQSMFDKQWNRGPEGDAKVQMMFQMFIDEIRRMREAQEQANNVAQSTDAKIN